MRRRRVPGGRSPGGTIGCAVVGTLVAVLIVGAVIVAIAREAIEVEPKPATHRPLHRRALAGATALGPPITREALRRPAAPAATRGTTNGTDGTRPTRLTNPSLRRRHRSRQHEPPSRRELHVRKRSVRAARRRRSAGEDLSSTTHPRFRCGRRGAAADGRPRPGGPSMRSAPLEPVRVRPRRKALAGVGLLLMIATLGLAVAAALALIAVLVGSALDQAVR